MNALGSSRRWSAPALLVALFSLACGPILMFSGGHLSGEEGTWPADLQRTAEIEEIQLETRPGDPHSVNIWVVVVDGNAYVATSLLLGPEVPDEREWVRNVAANPDVRVRIEGVVYPARLEVLDDEPLKSRLIEAYVAKYPQLDQARGEAARFYRIVNRNGAKTP
ncbi:MAG: nitroreductase family deazaflavin-dependent oxidoreductase [Deltaproteobacteria bacterium]|nr:nitroreductase family deazaflavin-dependent oxidoreductase [Deltaproteobacteria bacterium]MBW2397077.1 nitroreductase family deazaflavin-dependent oxidoreductase [Deltaproteobacteria bacterium]